MDGAWAFVVEDDATSLLAISTLLDDLGIAYKRNTTGSDVMAQLRAMRPAPDWIFLNLDLPAGDAFAICDQLRRDAAWKQTPVIAIADEFSAPVQQRVRDSGFTAMILKPLPRKTFGDYLRRMRQGENFLQAPVGIDR
jgi:CheY-like chemotaxis protein